MIKLFNVFLILLFFHSMIYCQQLTDKVDSVNFQEIQEIEYKAFANVFDATTFDIPFLKASISKEVLQISVELKNNKKTVYERVDSIGQFKYVYLSNFPSHDDYFVIRLNLKDKEHLLLSNDENASYKLYIKDITNSDFKKHKVIYGEGIKDKAFKFKSN